MTSSIPLNKVKYEAIVQFRNGVVRGYETVEQMLEKISVSGQRYVKLHVDRLSPLTLEDFLAMERVRKEKIGPSRN